MQRAYFDLLIETKREFPSFRIVPKSGNAFWECVHVLLLVLSFGTSDSKKFHTTVGTTIVSDAWGSISYSARYIALAHERVHMRQYRKLGFGNVKLGFCVFLFLYFFIFPVGFAISRAYFEREAYAESMRATLRMNPAFARSLAFKKRIVDVFTSGKYLWMFPFPKTVERQFDCILDRLIKEEGIDECG